MHPAGVPERPKGPDLSSGGNAFVGSNPTPCTKISINCSLAHDSKLIHEISESCKPFNGLYVTGDRR